MEALVGVAIGGAVALLSAGLSAWVTLTLQRRQSNAARRQHLFEKQLDAHAALTRQLGILNREIITVLATRRTPGADVAAAVRLLNERMLETIRVLDEQTFYLDRGVGIAVLDFSRLAQGVRDGAEPPESDVGWWYGRAIATIHDVMRVPDMATETYREATSRRARRWWQRERDPRRDVPPSER